MGRTTTRALDGREAPRAADAEEAIAAGDAGDAAAARRSGPSPRAIRTVAKAAAIVAAAAAAYAATRPHGGGEPLPPYATTASDPLQLGPASSIALTLHPTSRVDGDLDVRAALVRDGVASRWAPPIDVASDGTVRVAGPAAALVPGGDGACVAVLAIGHPGSVPVSADAIARAEDGPALRVVRVPIVVSGR